MRKPQVDFLRIWRNWGYVISQASTYRIELPVFVGIYCLFSSHTALREFHTLFLCGFFYFLIQNTIKQNIFLICFADDSRHLKLKYIVKIWPPRDRGMLRANHISGLKWSKYYIAVNRWPRSLLSAGSRDGKWWNWFSFVRNNGRLSITDMLTTWTAFEHSVTTTTASSS